MIMSNDCRDEKQSNESIAVDSLHYAPTDAQQSAVMRAAFTALRMQNKHRCSVSIMLTDDVTIHEYNRNYRSVDRPTDVLSFAANEGDELLSPPDGFLGDIMISVPRAEEQAASLGHSTERELMFLTVHGILHLLGYDHMNPDDEAVMLERQREIISDLTDGESASVNEKTEEFGEEAE